MPDLDSNNDVDEEYESDNSEDMEAELLYIREDNLENNGDDNYV